MLPRNRNSFLALRIRISDILSWERKPYLTHAILPRLPHKEYRIMVVLELINMVVKCYVKMTSSYHVRSQRIQEHLGAILETCGF